MANAVLFYEAQDEDYHTQQILIHENVSVQEHYHVGLYSSSSRLYPYFLIQLDNFEMMVAGVAALTARPIEFLRQAVRVLRGDGDACWAFSRFIPDKEEVIKLVDDGEGIRVLG